MPAPPGLSVLFPMLSRLHLALLPGLLLAPDAAFARTAPAPASEIVVSSVNYALTPPKVLKKIFRERAELTEAPPPSAAPTLLRYYQFLLGERLESDLSYLEVCQLLVPALAAKNLRNTRDLSKVELVLRVTFGSRTWRDPFVRNGDLEWRHGLVPRRRIGTSLGAYTAWDERAGGDESSLHQTEQFLTELNPTGGSDGLADRLIGGLHTEDYHLIVVDAFEVADLRAQGNFAPRAWTTFIAVPRRGKARFSDLAAAMIARAAPYFGETLPGKVRFTDREGAVVPGDIRVIETDVPAPKR